MSPKLFSSALEDMFKTLDWKGMGININGEYISHLRFAESLEELKRMLDVLASASHRIGLGMNVDKTKIMVNDRVDLKPVIVNGNLEVVSEYTYLGQILQLGNNSDISSGHSQVISILNTY
ncbi:uncharacterized protein [Choristoneura fumiferana]|uniref:uncharacterized protein n=1 Tax=Choristoneura fumiferana TaxID=7141 RepID=UPI003D15D630